MTALCYIIAFALAVVASVHYHASTTLPLAVAFLALGLLLSVEWVAQGVIRRGSS